MNQRGPEATLWEYQRLCSHNHINNCFLNQLLPICISFNFHCIILTFGKQAIVSKKGSFAPPAPLTERQEGHLLSSAPSLASLPGAQPISHIKKNITLNKGTMQDLYVKTRTIQVHLT